MILVKYNKLEKIQTPTFYKLQNRGIQNSQNNIKQCYCEYYAKKKKTQNIAVNLAKCVKSYNMAKLEN